VLLFYIRMLDAMHHHAPISSMFYYHVYLKHLQRSRDALQ
jgi:hypothetical protein